MMRYRYTDQTIGAVVPLPHQLSHQPWRLRAVSPWRVAGRVSASWLPTLLARRMVADQPGAQRRRGGV